MERMKAFMKGVGKLCSYLFFTPSWGSKRRKAQKEYEEHLDEVMRLHRQIT